MTENNNSNNIQNGFKSDGTYSFGGTNNPVPNQSDNANRNQAQTSYQQYRQQYVPNPYNSQQYTAQPQNYSSSNYKSNNNNKERKKLSVGGINVPTIIISVAAAAIIGLGGGFIGAKLGSSNETVIKSEDGTKVVFQAIERTSNKDSQSSYSVADVSNAVSNSVVEITTEVVSTNNYMGQYISQGAGSGVIITTDGYIVTNHHVINGAKTISVTLKDGTSHTAEVIGDDAKTDLAVLKIDASGLTPAVFGDSDKLTVGQTAIAIGNPLGQLGGTVTSGIVSALDREIDIDGETMNLLQTSAAINPGNSGGGLFDDNGNLIGIVNAKSSGSDIEGLGFAIPCNTVKTIISDLMEYGYVKGRVGLGISTVAINNAQTAWMYGVNETGLYISKVENGSDAENAGLHTGDKILSFNGNEISSDSDLSNALKNCSVGDTVKIEVKRNGNSYEVEITLTEYKG